MKEVSGRLLASLWELVAGTNQPVTELVADLSLDPDAVQLRWDYASVATFLDRALQTVGDEDAFIGAFRHVEAVAPDLVAVVPALRSLPAIARFVWSTVMPANLTCLESELTNEGDDAYTIHYRLHDHYAPSRGLMLAFEGLHRGLPRIAWREEAIVRREGTPSAFVLRVQLPASALTGPAPRPTPQDRHKASRYLGAMLSDRTHLRSDAAQLARALRRVGAAAYEATDSATFAAAVVSGLVEDLLCSFVALSVSPSPASSGHGPTLLATHGERPAVVIVAPLFAEVAGERVAVGSIEFRGAHGLETLQPLFSLAAVALARRIVQASSPSRAGQFPADWRLTKRQRDVAEQVAGGASNPMIAQRLGCGVGTVEEHLTAIYAKAAVDGRQPLAAAILAYRRAL
jgi:DNA-binding CsgD family transcriptional regulator